MSFSIKKEIEFMSNSEIQGHLERVLDNMGLAFGVGVYEDAFSSISRRTKNHTRMPHFELFANNHFIFVKQESKRHKNKSIASKSFNEIENLTKHLSEYYNRISIRNTYEESTTFEINHTNYDIDKKSVAYNDIEKDEHANRIYENWCKIIDCVYQIIEQFTLERHSQELKTWNYNLIND